MAKKKGIKLILIVFSVLILFAAACVGYAFAEYKGSFKSGETCTVVIDEGSSVADIANSLKTAGAIDNELIFRLYSKLSGNETKYNYGEYEFKNNIGYEKIAEILKNEGAKAETVRVVIPEGTGINDFTKNVDGSNVTVPGIATLLEQAGVCSKAEFFSALDRVSLDTKLLSNVNKEEAYCALEGYLFPETYDFYIGDADFAVRRMIEESEKRITDEMYLKAEQMGYSMNEILTMASIIQMESGRSGPEMKGVAAVFYNRLNSSSFVSLGSSPTIYYGNAYPQDDGRYHTQSDHEFTAIKGLPPGPLCSPSIDAINAALYPDSKPGYYYFVTDKQGKFYYHKTASEQENTISRLIREGNWTYEYFN